VVRYNDADAPVFQGDHDLLQIDNRQRVDSGERLVEKQEFRLEDERTADFKLPPFSSAQAVGRLLSQSKEAELPQELMAQSLFFLLLIREKLQDQLEVFLYRGFKEDRILLGEIGDPEPGSLRRGAPGNILSVKKDGAVVWLDEPYNHLESRGLAGSVASQEPDDLARTDLKVHPLNHGPAAVPLNQACRFKDGH